MYVCIKSWKYRSLLNHRCYARVIRIPYHINHIPKAPIHVK